MSSESGALDGVVRAKKKTGPKPKTGFRGTPPPSVDHDWPKLKRALRDAAILVKISDAPWKEDEAFANLRNKYASLFPDHVTG